MSSMLILPAIRNPTVERRLDAGVFEPGALQQIGGCVLMVAAVFDVDSEVAHRTKMPATDQWWSEEIEKIIMLRQAHPGAFIFRTRGGYRIVNLLASPVELRSAEEAKCEKWTPLYLAWVAYLWRRFAIRCDCVADWQRLFRLPHATRA